MKCRKSKTSKAHVQARWAENLFSAHSCESGLSHKRRYGVTTDWKVGPTNGEWLNVLTEAGQILRVLKVKAHDIAIRGLKVTGIMVGVLIAACTGAAVGQTPVDRFMELLDADPAIPADATTMIREAWSRCHDCDGDEFLTQGLALLSPGFRDGLDAYDADRYEQAASIMSKLRKDSNPFVAAHSAAYEIKSLVAMDRLLEAGERIEDLLEREPGDLSIIADYSYLAPEIAFLHGYCLLSDLQYVDSAYALTQFLQTYPDASQRLVISAQQMLAELKNRQPGRIAEVVDLMSYAGRRLNHRDSSDVVQMRQHRIIDILDRLIEEAEDQESSSSSGRSGGQRPNSPMPDSRLPGGRAQEGPLQAARRANPGEAWGAMPPAQRERILQALRDNFPSRYRRLVEQYYEQLGKKH